jgi:ABC-type Mn2+/Zn2+ transport system permease subunit
MSFWDARFLWMEIVIAAAAVGAATAVVGLHTTLRRVVFLPAALSQLSGAGVVLAFLLGHVLGAGHCEEFCDQPWSLPWGMAVLFACAGALVLGFVREGTRITREWLMGAVFIGSSVVVLLLGGIIGQELHDVTDVLFGNAIALSTGHMVQALLMSGTVLLLHFWLAPMFLSYAFDPVAARAHGIPVRLLDSVLFLSMGVAIASGTRVVGALPEFAFAVFPGMAALSLVRQPRLLVLVAAFFGALVAFLGYWASFKLSLPTGATMAAVALLLVVVVKGVKGVVGRG